MKTYLIIGAAFLLLCGGWFVSCKVQKNQNQILALQLKASKDSIAELQTPVLHTDTITLPGVTKTLPADTVFSHVKDTVWRSDTTAKVYTGSDSSEFLTIKWKIVSPRLYSKQFTYTLRQQIIQKDSIYYLDRPYAVPTETPKIHLNAFAGIGQRNTCFGGIQFQSKERWGFMYQYNTTINSGGTLTGNHQAGFTYRIF